MALRFSETPGFMFLLILGRQNKIFFINEWIQGGKKVVKDNLEYNIFERGTIVVIEKKGHRRPKAEQHYLRDSGAPPPPELTPSCLPPIPLTWTVSGETSARGPRGLMGGSWEERKPDQVWGGRFLAFSPLGKPETPRLDILAGPQVRHLVSGEAGGVEVPTWETQEALPPLYL